MEIKKIETCKNKNLYFNETKIKPKRYCKLIETKVVNIYPDITYQSIVGFGGAITEATAYNYSLLPDEKKKEFMNDYFDKINYSLCRLTIGSCDFALKSYSYSYKKDLSDFSIEHDKKYVIPFIKDALTVNPNLKFIASPWSPPKFMKNTKMLILGGKLLKKYKQTYADYLSKYFMAYKELGINIDYMTIQNETNAMPIWESCLYSPSDEVDFLVNYLYPTFMKNNISTKILIYDHNKEKLVNRALEEFSNPEALKCASGIAFHWYSGSHFENISICRQLFPDKLLFHTEGCFDFEENNSYPNQYAHDMAEDLNAGINGYMDWNMLLDHRGGPTHTKNHCGSPVILTEDNSDYKKRMAYYYIGHFSKTIQPGAKRIAYSKYNEDIIMTAFKNPDGTIAVVIVNRKDYDIEYRLCIKNKMFKEKMAGQSIVSYIIKE